MKLFHLVLCLVFIDFSNNYRLLNSLTQNQESTVVVFLICLVMIENQAVVKDGFHWLLAQQKVTCHYMNLYVSSLWFQKKQLMVSHNSVCETISWKLTHDGFIQWKLTHSTVLETHKFVQCAVLV